MSGLRLWRNW